MSLLYVSFLYVSVEHVPDLITFSNPRIILSREVVLSMETARMDESKTHPTSACCLQRRRTSSVLNVTGVHKQFRTDAYATSVRDLLPQRP